MNKSSMRERQRRKYWTSTIESDRWGFGLLRLLVNDSKRNVD
jgi:hypothetical protein